MVLTCRNQEIVVHFAETGEEAISILVRDPYDVVVIAPGLPDFDGPGLIRRLRNCRVSTPILMLTSNGTAADRERALWDGADCVMAVPWHRGEMVARLKSLSRRANGHHTSRISVGPLVLDQERMQVLRVDGTSVHMTEKEYLIFELLATRAGRVCTKQQLMDHLYGGRDEPEEKIIDVFVCKARKKLGENGVIIATVWGRGYMIKSAVIPDAAAA